LNNKAMLHIGFGNIVMLGRVIAIISPDSAPVKRIVTEAKEKGNVIDVTHGRRTRAVIMMDNDTVILSSLTSETLGGRISGKLQEDEDEKGDF